MEFEVLKDLVQTITRNKIKQIEVLGNPGQENSRVETLYEGILKGAFASDGDAAMHFFGSNEKDPNYRKLRNRLVRQLINTSFFVDVQQPMFNERSKALFNCYRDYAAAHIIWGRDAEKAGIYLMQQVLEQTIKFEFTELTADICRQLRYLFALSPGDQANHEKYIELHRTYEEKRYWEAKAHDASDTLIHHYITKRTPSQEVHQLATRYFEELFPMRQYIDTLQFYTKTYHVGVIKYSSINNCQKTIEVCDEAISVLRNRANVSRGALVSFAIQKLACLIQLRVFDEGGQAVEYCLGLVDEGDFTWFRVQEMQFYYYMYLRQYPEALTIFEKATSNPRYNLLSGSTRDIWGMLGGYLHLLAVLGRLDAQEVKRIAGYYSPHTARYANDFEVLDKEKEGMNIPLLLLPVLYSLATGVSDEAAFRRSMEALDKYRKRYLDNDTNRRSSIFLKMLLAFAKKEFESNRAERKMEKEWALLKKEPPQMASQSFAVEIIPYEDLWEMLTS